KSRRHLAKSGHVTETIGHGSFAGKPSANFAHTVERPVCPKNRQATSTANNGGQMSSPPSAKSAPTYQ
ncbi:hypothetical protein, partial [Heliobacterium mobile]|uniref:hypothetical protein n=1 Tax=Heliobacterium mobile TaxID=28064 RepID=UPI001A9A8C94